VRRERGTLERKVEEQREALLKIKTAVDAFLDALDSMPITPSRVDPMMDHPELPMGQTLVETFASPLSDDTAAVVLDPSAAA
jgi:hypothetical protein